MNQTEFVIEPGRQDIIMTHTFDAPRALVFEVITDPGLVPKWWGPRSLETIVDHAEVRPGGSWRFRHRDAEGNEYGFKGVYHDVVPAERLVQTFEFEGMPGHVALETSVFEENDGRTTYRTVSVYQSVEDRDAVVQSGMEQGARETYERLAELVKSRL